MNITLSDIKAANPAHFSDSVNKLNKTKTVSLQTNGRGFQVKFVNADSIAIYEVEPVTLKLTWTHNTLTRIGN